MKKKIQNPFQDCEWQFDSVPDDELAACCIWEYGRESKTICDFIQIHGFFDSDTFDGDPEYYGSGEWPPFWQRPFPKPWQELEEPLRKKLIKLRRLPDPDEDEAFEIVTDSRWCRFKYKVPAGFNIPSAGKRMINPFGEELALANIQWLSFTNREIITSFKRWVNNNRPPGIGLANKKGKKKESHWRVMLDRLAIMRLLHHATLNDMPKEFPEASKRYASHDWYRERKNAKQDFQTLLSFLPVSDLPLSFHTRGSR